LSECAPRACVVVLVSSQRVFVLKEWPTGEPPEEKASKTLMASPSLSASCWKVLRMNWKRVSLTVVLLRTAVSVSCTVWKVEDWSKARSGSAYCETP
jgi:hypothetical protein